jgi:hypothetical protein
LGTVCGFCDDLAGDLDLSIVILKKDWRATVAPADTQMVGILAQENSKESGMSMGKAPGLIRDRASALGFSEENAAA